MNTKYNAKTDSIWLKYFQNPYTYSPDCQEYEYENIFKSAKPIILADSIWKKKLTASHLK